VVHDLALPGTPSPQSSRHGHTADQQPGRREQALEHALTVLTVSESGVSVLPTLRVTVTMCYRPSTFMSERPSVRLDVSDVAQRWSRRVTTVRGSAQQCDSCAYLGVDTETQVGVHPQHTPCIALCFTLSAILTAYEQTRTVMLRFEHELTMGL